MAEFQIKKRCKNFPGTKKKFFEILAQNIYDILC